MCVTRCKFSSLVAANALLNYFSLNLLIYFFVKMTYPHCERYIYNLGNGILELYNVLLQTRLTTSKTKRDI